MSLLNIPTGAGTSVVDSAGDPTTLRADPNGILQSSDMALGLGGASAPLASVALNTADLGTNGTEVPAGSTYVFQALLIDNPSAIVLLRVDDTTPQTATALATAQRALVNTARVAVPGPCYVFPTLIEADGTAATATANDVLLRSKL